MFSELYRVTLAQEQLTVPKYLPNNLKKIKAIYKITDKELAHRLNIEPSYISSVSNSRATFSGGITIKLLDELGINFSFFSNINDTIKTNCYEFNDALVVVSTDKKLHNSNMEDLNKIAYEFIKEYDGADTQISVILFSELEHTSNLYSINSNNNFYAELGEEKLKQ